MSIIRNLKKSISNVIEAATNIVSVTSELVVDTTSLTSKAIAAVPKAVHETADIIPNTRKGYISERDNIEIEKVPDFQLSGKELGIKAGRLVAELLKEEEE